MKYLWLFAALFILLPIPANAGERFTLIAIVFSADQTKYADKVNAYPDKESCEIARAVLHKNALQQFGKEAFIFSVCTKPRSLGAVEV